jgi:spermidine synthase
MKIEVTAPDGKSGDWKVETFTVTEKEIELFNVRAMFKPGSRTMEAGTYKRLMRKGEIVMSNTPAEIADLRHFIAVAKFHGGDILINGLGLGVALNGILDSDKITSVTVIEKSQDVIDLVGPSISDKRVHIICADAFEWKPPKNIRYTCVWHDIFDDICSDNLPEMTRLHRKYAKKTDWQDSWCKALCKRY